MKFEFRFYLTEHHFVESQMNKNLFERSDGYYITFFNDEKRNTPKISIRNNKFLPYNHICTCKIPDSFEEADTLFYLLDL